MQEQLTMFSPSPSEEAPSVGQLIEEGYLFVLNHSGGKDSQAAYIRLRGMIPEGQLIVVHAILHEVDWAGIPEHIEATVSHPVYYVAAAKSLLDMVEHRGMFPSPSQRQCTSDLKRGPIETFIRRYLREHPEFAGKVVNAMGLRAEESPARAKIKDTLKKNDGNSKAGRSWFDWLPIHEMTEGQVFRAIADAKQTPHPAYAAGMSRLSCCFCIMANTADLTTAARLQPELYRRYVELERKHDHTMSMSRKTLPEITGIDVEEVHA